MWRKDEKLIRNDKLRIPDAVLSHNLKLKYNDITMNSYSFCKIIPYDDRKNKKNVYIIRFNFRIIESVNWRGWICIGSFFSS